MTPEQKDKPVIGISMGDAAGIGPEVVLKALSVSEILRVCNPVIIGDESHLRRVAESFGPAHVLNSREVKVIDLENLPESIEYGKDAEVTGRASAEYIEAAVELWRRGAIDALVTAPISKKAIALGGYNFPGHTEFLARLTDTEHFAMSFFAGKLRVILLSTHISLRNAIKLVREENLIDLITFADVQFGKLLRKKPRIAVAGLNPHASEGGLFGSEEHDEIIPAVQHCSDSLGIDVYGPFSPDTIFLRCSRGEFDAVVALYHDQATIPVKSLSFNSGVNVTLGLPLIRTSVDHGTAYEIAGKGVAEASSMQAAIRLAAELVSGS